MTPRTLLEILNRIDRRPFKESVISILNTPPGSPDDRDKHIVGTSPTGAWSGHANEIAEWVEGESLWRFYEVETGAMAWVISTGTRNLFNGTNWDLYNSLGRHERSITQAPGGSEGVGRLFVDQGANEPGGGRRGRWVPQIWVNTSFGVMLEFESADINMNNGQVFGLSNQVDPTSAATRGYVDGRNPYALSFGGLIASSGQRALLANGTGDASSIAVGTGLSAMTHRHVVPFNGTIRNVTIQFQSSQSSTDPTIILWKNGSVFGSPLTIPTNVLKHVFAVSHSVDAGDDLSVIIENSGGTTGNTVVTLHLI